MQRKIYFVFYDMETVTWSGAKSGSPGLTGDKPDQPEINIHCEELLLAVKIWGQTGELFYSTQVETL